MPAMAVPRRRRGVQRVIGPTAVVGAVAAVLWIATQLSSPSPSPAETPAALESDRAVIQDAQTAQPSSTGSGVDPSAASIAAQPASLAPSADISTAARPRLAPALPRWLRVIRETGLWSGPEDAQEFTKIPAESTVRVLERQGARFRVYYAGDEELKRPGEAWINASDAAEAEWPRFVRTRGSVIVRTAPSETAPIATSLPSRTYLEVIETSGRDWAHIFLASRPDTGEPLDAWVDGEDVQATPRDSSEFLEYTLTRSLLQSQTPDAWLNVPYRTQLDGSAYEAANCGPTVLWMALQRHSNQIPNPGALRGETLRYQEIDRCDDCGVFIEHLAAVAEGYGASTVGLFDRAPDAFHRWSADEIRAQLRQGRVVIPQVMFRFLSGRERSDYWGDHYVVLTGYVGDRFIYHDPIDTRGPGSSRTISTERLLKAMEYSDYPYAAFALGQ